MPKRFLRDEASVRCPQFVWIVSSLLLPALINYAFYPHRLRMLGFKLYKGETDLFCINVLIYVLLNSSFILKVYAILKNKLRRCCLTKSCPIMKRMNLNLLSTRLQMDLVHKLIKNCN